VQQAVRLTANTSYLEMLQQVAERTIMDINVRDQLSTFLTIIRPKDTPLKRLQISAQESNVTLRFEYETNGEEYIFCRALLNDIGFGTSVEKTRSRAKMQAVKQTLAILAENYPTLEVLHPYTLTQVAIRTPGEGFDSFMNREITAMSQDPTAGRMMVCLDEEERQNIKAVQELCFFYGFQSNYCEDSRILCISRKLNYLSIYMHISTVGDNAKYRVVGGKYLFGGGQPVTME